MSNSSVLSLDFDLAFSLLYSNKSKHWIKLSKLTSAYLYRLKTRVNVISGKVEPYDIENFLKQLDSKKIFQEQQFRILHCFYELGNMLEGFNVSEDEVLAIDLVYEQKTNVDFTCVAKGRRNWVCTKEPSKTEYGKKINVIQESIRDGQFYQLNFTKRWNYKSQQDFRMELNEFLKKKSLHSPLAHVTSLPMLGLHWISNTPECLFVAKMSSHKNKIIMDSFPIKGTQKISGTTVEDEKKAVGNLIKSKKDLAELDMITDLVRNDLNRIQKPGAQVLKRRLYIKVPGLLQQLSWVRGYFDRSLKLGEVLRALFPGGSITGAPKKSSMKKINELECDGDPRGFYCGTTIYHEKNQCAASINIRSLSFLNTKDGLDIRLGAGGGITLKSRVEGEWQEMINKKNSLLKLWGMNL